MYLASFIHREELFGITERWLRGRPEPGDGLRLTEILICDGFILGETLASVTRLLIELLHSEPFEESQIHSKGELRDVLAGCAMGIAPRADELIRAYTRNPDFYYREAPINGVVCTSPQSGLLGVYRLKRPKRIAEKANRYIAGWLFQTVKDRARAMARVRATQFGIPLEHLLTPEEEMVREFVESEEFIARSFSEGLIRFKRAPLTIQDVGGVKIIAGEEQQRRLE
ncbi:MAG: hypothetical protein ACLGPL_03220, partial [Acidobacteriota bacterium]